jgi:hypothetical protein
MREGRLAPIKPREIANGIIYCDKLERCDAPFNVHSPRDVAVRETNLELVRPRKVVRRLRCSEQGVPSPCPKKEESHASLRGAIMGSLEQAEPDLIAALYMMRK